MCRASWSAPASRGSRCGKRCTGSRRRRPVERAVQSDRREDRIAHESATQTNWEPSPIPGISRNVLLLSAVSLLTDISSEMVYPLVPLFLSGTLGAPPAVVGVIEGIAEATASLFKWISGALSDHWGKRKPFVLAGYGLAAFTKPLLAVAGAWPVVLAARVLDRFGKGLRGSPRDALIADSTPPELRGRAFGFHRSGDSIGAVCGPLLALLLMALIPGGYRTAFLIAFIPGILSTLLLVLVHDRAVPPAPSRPLFSLAVLRRGDPALRRFLLITLIFAVGNSSDMFLILRARQLSGSNSIPVLLFALCNTVNVLSSYPAGILSDRAGRRGVLAFSFFLFSAIYLGVGMAQGIGPLWALFPAYGLFLGLSDGVSKAFIVDLVPDADRGAALGLQAAITGVSTLPASIVAGLLWEWAGPWAAFVYGSATAFVAGVLMLALARRRDARRL